MRVNNPTHVHALHVVGGTAGEKHVRRPPAGRKDLIIQSHTQPLIHLSI